MLRRFIATAIVMVCLDAIFIGTVSGILAGAIYAQTITAPPPTPLPRRAPFRECVVRDFNESNADFYCYTEFLW